MSKAKRGAVIPPDSTKTRITIRIDTDTLEWFREQVENVGGGNYQTMINSVLRDHVSPQEKRLEDTLRRVIREELRAVG